MVDAEIRVQKRHIEPDEPTEDDMNSTSRNNADLCAAPSPGTPTDDEDDEQGFINPINTAHAVGEGESIG
jgi:hypothetical protein